MAIVQAGKQFSADSLKTTAGHISSMLVDFVEQGLSFKGQLESFPDADLIVMGLTQEEINAIKGFFIGDLPAISAALKNSAWIKQLLGTGV